MLALSQTVIQLKNIIKIHFLRFQPFDFVYSECSIHKYLLLLYIGYASSNIDECCCSREFSFMFFFSIKINAVGDSPVLKTSEQYRTPENYGIISRQDEVILSQVHCKLYLISQKNMYILLGEFLHNNCT